MSGQDIALIDAIMRYIVPIAFLTIAGMASDVFLGLAVYYDAQARQNEYAVLWGVLSGFFPIAALVYLIVKASSKPKAAYCPRCGGLVPAGYPACPRCGMPAWKPLLAPELADRYRQRCRLFLILWIVTLVIVLILSILLTAMFIQNIVGIMQEYRPYEEVW